MVSGILPFIVNLLTCGTYQGIFLRAELRYFDLYTDHLYPSKL